MAYKSVQQARFFHARSGRDIPESTVKEYDRATDFKSLPKRAGKGGKIHREHMKRKRVKR